MLSQFIKHAFSVYLYAIISVCTVLPTLVWTVKILYSDSTEMNEGEAYACYFNEKIFYLSSSKRAKKGKW